MTEENKFPLDKYCFNDWLFMKKMIILKTWSNDLILVNKTDFIVMDILNDSVDWTSRLNTWNIPNERSRKENHNPQARDNNLDINNLNDNQK